MNRLLCFSALAFALVVVAGCDRTAGVTYRVGASATAANAIEQTVAPLGFTPAAAGTFGEARSVIAAYARRAEAGAIRPLSVVLWKDGTALNLFIGRATCCGVSVEEEALIREVVTAITSSGVTLSEGRPLGLREPRVLERSQPEPGAR